MAGKFVKGTGRHYTNVAIRKLTEDRFQIVAWNAKDDRNVPLHFRGKVLVTVLSADEVAGDWSTERVNGKCVDHPLASKAEQLVSKFYGM